MREVGGEGQERLRRAAILIAGVGGLGSPVAQYLAAAGVGRLGLVDFDAVDLSNLQRQVVFGTPDIGRPKVQAAFERLQSLNPRVEFDLHGVVLDEGNAANLVSRYDVVVSALDNASTRFALNDACVRLAKPMVEAGILRFDGLLMTVIPGKGPCLRCVFPEPPSADDLPTCASAGVIGALAGVMGSLQALEVVKLLLGKGETFTGRILRFDGLTGRFREIPWPRNRQCPVCKHV